MSFVQYHKPCPLCGSSDAASINDDGSAYCFSCYTRIPNYDNPEEKVEDFRTYKNNSMNNNEGSFSPLTDRSISLETAKKFGVKSTTNSDGSVQSHLYPYYIANEMVGTKVRNCKTKEFNWRG